MGLYLKGLIFIALLCSLCVNANVVPIGKSWKPSPLSPPPKLERRCKDIKRYCRRCRENAFGQVIDIEFVENVIIEHEFFTYLSHLEKVTFSGEQHNIQQYNLEEMTTISSLTEVHLNSNAFTSSKYNMTIFQKITKLTIFEVSGVDYIPRIFPKRRHPNRKTYPKHRDHHPGHHHAPGHRNGPFIKVL